MVSGKAKTEAEHADLRLTLPNALTALRLLAVPVLLYLALTHRPEAFLAVFVACLLTDSVDGDLARRFHTASTEGARLDSVADFTMYSCLAVSSWFLWPERIGREFPVFVAAILGYVTPVIVGLVRYGKLTSYHTRGAKLSAVLMGLSVVLLLVSGQPWPFRVATVVMVAAGMEEIAISLALAEWRADVPSFRHALRLRRAERSQRLPPQE
jgi:CDP-diacylglycerol--glycerol-3-phosphate 3-phosphatidyltransferase